MILYFGCLLFVLLQCHTLQGVAASDVNSKFNGWISKEIMNYKVPGFLESFSWANDTCTNLDNHGDNSYYSQQLQIITQGNSKSFCTDAPNMGDIICPFSDMIIANITFAEYKNTYGSFPTDLDYTFEQFCRLDRKQLTPMVRTTCIGKNNCQVNLQSYFNMLTCRGIWQPNAFYFIANYTCIGRHNNTCYLYDTFCQNQSTLDHFSYSTGGDLKWNGPWILTNVTTPSYKAPGYLGANGIFTPDAYSFGFNSTRSMANNSLCVNPLKNVTFVFHYIITCNSSRAVGLYFDSTLVCWLNTTGMNVYKTELDVRRLHCNLGSVISGSHTVSLVTSSTPVKACTGLFIRDLTITTGNNISVCNVECPRSRSASHRSHSHRSKSHRSQSHRSKSHHSKSHHSHSHHSKSHYSESHRSKSHHSDSHVSKSRHSKSHHSKSHASISHESKSHHSKSRHSKSHHSDSHESKSHHSKSHHSKSHESISHASNSHHSKSRHSESHVSKSHHSKSHESASHASKSHHSESHHSKSQSDSHSRSKSHESHSKSHSHSHSRSQKKTKSQSHSQSTSTSHSKSQSVSVSNSQSKSRSQSTTTSKSQSASRSKSASKSMSASKSSSGSDTQSLSASDSLTITQSESMTTSDSGSRSQTQSQTQTPTPPPVQTPTRTKTRTNSKSRSHSMTNSETTSESLSHSTTKSMSTSKSSSNTQSKSMTDSNSDSSSYSDSDNLSSSQTQSMTASGSHSRLCHHLFRPCKGQSGGNNPCTPSPDNAAFNISTFYRGSFMVPFNSTFTCGIQFELFPLNNAFTPGAGFSIKVANLFPTLSYTNYVVAVAFYVVVYGDWIAPNTLTTVHPLLVTYTGTCDSYQNIVPIESVQLYPQVDFATECSEVYSVLLPDMPSSQSYVNITLAPSMPLLTSTSLDVIFENVFAGNVFYIGFIQLQFADGTIFKINANTCNLGTPFPNTPCMCSGCCDARTFDGSLSVH